MASILRCIDAQVSQRGKGGAYLAYGAAFVGFVLALRYYREVRRLRQLNVAQKEAFDMHVLKVGRASLSDCVFSCNVSASAPTNQLPWTRSNPMAQTTGRAN